jgi:hypothetical protein
MGGVQLAESSSSGGSKSLTINTRIFFLWWILVVAVWISGWLLFFLDVFTGWPLPFVG